MSSRSFFPPHPLDFRDPHRCHSVLTSGQWLDPPSRSASPFTKWQPDHCTLRPFKGRRASLCLSTKGGGENIFIGDSTVRELFWAMARALNKDAAKQANQKAQKHSDLTFGDGQSLTRFIWDPLLNSSETSNRIRQKLSSGQGSDSGLLIFGGGLWFLRDKPRPVDDFKDTVGTLTDQFPNPDAETKGKHRALIVPVQTPYYENLDAEHRAFMQEEKVTAMNEYLAQLPTMHDVDVLTSFMEMYQGLPGSAYEPTGRHVAPTISDRQAEVILNLKCNDEQREYTYDGSCCFEYTMDYFQFAILVCGALLLAMIGWVEIQSKPSCSVPKK